MDWIAKSYGSDACGGLSGKTQRKTEVLELPSGAVVSEDELAHLEQCLSNPKGPSSTILQGQALLLRLRQKRR